MVAAEEKTNLFLLVGQSNMSGRGSLDEIKNDTTNQMAVYMYSNSGEWKQAVEPVDDATGQVDPVSADINAGYSSSLSFGVALSNYTSKTIGLIPCAKGGSTIADWKPGTSRNTLYGSCLARAHEAQKYGTVRGILFYQGESDAATESLVDSYSAKFQKIVAALRRDFNNPSLPVVFAQIGKNPNDPRFPCWDNVKHMQENIKIPNVCMIKTDDLPAKGLHLTSKGYVELGKRFAEAMNVLIGD